MNKHSPGKRFLKLWENRPICFTLDVIARRLSQGGQFILRDRDILHRLLTRHQVFIIHMSAEDESDVVRKCVEELYPFGLKEHRVMFCSTQKGKQAMGRQLNPEIYFDTCEKTVQHLKPHLFETVLVNEQEKFSASWNGFTTSSISCYLDTNSPKENNICKLD